MKNRHVMAFISAGSALAVLAFVLLSQSAFWQGPSPLRDRKGGLSLAAAAVEASFMASVSPGTSTASVDNGSSATSSSAQAPAPVVSLKPTYRYKMAYGIGECGFNKLGQQGWQALQFGTPSLQGPFTDYVCNQGFFGISFDWVLFQLQQ